MLLSIISIIAFSQFIAKSFLISDIKFYLAKNLIWYKKQNYLPNTSPYLYTRSIKPFDCAPCLTFWLTLSYLIITNNPIEHIILLPFLTFKLQKLNEKYL